MSKITFTVEKSVFGRSAVLRAGHSFLDRAYVAIGEDADAGWQISLEQKEGAAALSGLSLEGEFRNALVNEAFRDSLMEGAQTVKELIVAKALYGGAAAAGASEQGAADGDEDEFAFVDEELDDYLSDPLGIAVPWEERRDTDGKPGTEE